LLLQALSTVATAQYAATSPAGVPCVRTATPGPTVWRCTAAPPIARAPQDSRCCSSPTATCLGVCRPRRGPRRVQWTHAPLRRRPCALAAACGWHIQPSQGMSARLRHITVRVTPCAHPRSIGCARCQGVLAQPDSSALTSVKHSLVRTTDRARRHSIAQTRIRTGQTTTPARARTRTGATTHGPLQPAEPTCCTLREAPL
jgi:hypothetical protein